MQIDHTHDVTATSWLESANVREVDFPIQNLPLTVFRRVGTREAFRVGVAIGDQVIDLTRLSTAWPSDGARARWGTDGTDDAAKHESDDSLRAALDACAAPTLNAFVARGRRAWTALRHGLFEMLSHDADAASIAAVREALVPIAQIEHAVPFAIGDYTDFYTSIDHALNIGNLLRPPMPLSPNFRWMPIAYHGRVSSIGVSGQQVYRPRGQALDAEGVPAYRPCANLDYEMELGAFVGQATGRGETLSVARAADSLFGVCLLNDWSARDIQWWEMAPLGPFLAKNFATTLSPWVVTLDALAPYRVPRKCRAEQPPPLAYLDSSDDREAGALDVRVEVRLHSAAQREAGLSATVLSQTTFAHQYWTFGQMLAHHASGGCPMNVGDLLGSGTISGPGEGQAGALIELSRAGHAPVQLGNGERRAFVEDGDSLIMRGWCERDGFARIGFGECRATVSRAAS